MKNKHVFDIITAEVECCIGAFFTMARYFAVLLVICLAVSSGTTTTKPQVQQKTDASKDLCEVSTIAQHFTQLIVTWVTTLKKTCFRLEGKFLREYEDIGTNSNQETREIYSN